MWFLNKNNFISQNYRSFSETTVMGLGKILWKFEHDQIIFLEFTGIESFKHKEIRVSGAKLFLRSIHEKNAYMILTHLCLAVSVLSSQIETNQSGVWYMWTIWLRKLFQAVLCPTQLFQWNLNCTFNQHCLSYKVSNILQCNSYLLF